VDAAARVHEEPEQDANTSVCAATSPDLDGVSGRFFANSRQARTSKASYDQALAERLWTVSAHLVGLAGPPTTRQQASGTRRWSGTGQLLR
jgi:hypothetical protein